MGDKLKIAVIGSGISGISVARMLSDSCDITVFEGAERIGGLIKCKDVDGNLYHQVGGHVFNSKNQNVLDWFWSFFDKDLEFVKATRYAKIWLNGLLIGYPIENHIYQLEPVLVEKIIGELLEIKNAPSVQPPGNFCEFLLNTFGQTLFDVYFKPYNNKLWGQSLEDIPLEWLEGKLPMPDITEVILSNIKREEESDMVHATFFYPKKGGSQFIVNRLAEGLEIKTSARIGRITSKATGVDVGGEYFDRVVYTGDVRKLSSMLAGFDVTVTSAAKQNQHWKSRATSNVFCAMDANELSWMYLPEENTKAHRVIYTGNFSPSNNKAGQHTCVVEFSGEVELAEMLEQIKSLPGNLRPLASNFEANSYIIHEADTKEKIDMLRAALEKKHVYLLGRFAEWEYYNMDKCIESGFRLRDQILA